MTDAKIAYLSDRREIEDLIIRYEHARDRAEWHLFDEIFTDDATYDAAAAGLGVHSPESLAKLFRSMRQEDPTRVDRASGRHTVSNISVRVHGDTASGYTEIEAERLDRVSGRPSRGTFRLSSGFYIDEFRRTAAGWRLAKRAVYIKSNLPVQVKVPGGANTLGIIAANALEIEQAATQQRGDSASRVSPSPAGRNTSFTLDELTDRQQITDALIALEQALGLRRSRTFDEVFTDDATVDDAERQNPVGYRAFRDQVSSIQSQSARAPQQHLLRNSLVELSGDTATAVSMFDSVERRRTSEPGVLEERRVGGWYEDRLVRAESGWRISQRVIHVIRDTREWARYGDDNPTLTFLDHAVAASANQADFFDTHDYEHTQ